MLLQLVLIYRRILHAQSVCVRVLQVMSVCICIRTTFVCTATLHDYTCCVLSPSMGLDTIHGETWYQHSYDKPTTQQQASITAQLGHDSHNSHMSQA